MPKPRNTDRRQQEFVVQAWNSISKQDTPVGASSQSSHAEIEFADLVQPESLSPPVPGATPNANSTAHTRHTGVPNSDPDPPVAALILPRTAVPPPSCHDTPWVHTSVGNKRPREAPPQPRPAPTPHDPFLDELIPSNHLGSNPHITPPSPTSTHPGLNQHSTTTIHPSLELVASPEDPLNADADVDPPAGFSFSYCSGVCQLVLLPDGEISGHFVDAASHRCYGIMGTPVESEDASSTCEYEAGEQVGEHMDRNYA